MSALRGILLATFVSSLAVQEPTARPSARSCTLPRFMMSFGGMPRIRFADVTCPHHHGRQHYAPSTTDRLIKSTRLPKRDAVVAYLVRCLSAFKSDRIHCHAQLPNFHTAYIPHPRLCSRSRPSFLDHCRFRQRYRQFAHMLGLVKCRVYSLSRT